jgi:hypothetical protein
MNAAGRICVRRIGAVALGVWALAALSFLTQPVPQGTSVQAFTALPAPDSARAPAGTQTVERQRSDWATARSLYEASAVPGASSAFSIPEGSSLLAVSGESQKVDADPAGAHFGRAPPRQSAV